MSVFKADHAHSIVWPLSRVDATSYLLAVPKTTGIGRSATGLTFTGYALHSPLMTAFSGGDSGSAGELVFTVEV